MSESTKRRFPRIASPANIVRLACAGFAVVLLCVISYSIRPADEDVQVSDVEGNASYFKIPHRNPVSGYELRRLQVTSVIRGFPGRKYSIVLDYTRSLQRIANLYGRWSQSTVYVHNQILNMPVGPIGITNRTPWGVVSTLDTCLRTNGVKIVKLNGGSIVIFCPGDNL